jgi:hypothetical protein
MCQLVFVLEEILIEVFFSPLNMVEKVDRFRLIYFDLINFYF